MVSHSALNIGTLRHALGCEFKLQCRQTLSDPSTTSMLSSWFYLAYLIWYYYLSVKFVMRIVKQKIESRRNLFKKNIVSGLWVCWKSDRKVHQWWRRKVIQFLYCKLQKQNWGGGNCAGHYVEKMGWKNRTGQQKIEFMRSLSKFTPSNSSLFICLLDSF